MNNPSELIELLEDIEGEILTWNSTVGEVHVDSLRFLTEFNDCRASFQSRVVYLGEEVASNNEQADQLKTRQSMLTQSLKTLSSSVVQLRHESESLLNNVSSLLAQWHSEEQKAREWEGKSLNQLAAAQAQLATAESNLVRARSGFASARSALSSCEGSGYRDNNGYYHAPNCSNEINSVAHYSAQISRYQGEVGTAQAYVNVSAVELGKARARLKLCVSNVQVASRGKAAAEDADSIARNAICYKEKTAESLQVVHDKMNEIVMNQKHQQQCLDAMQESVDHCKERLSVAEDGAHGLKGAVQRLDDSSPHAQYVLSGLVEKLEAFDFSGDI